MIACDLLDHNRRKEFWLPAQGVVTADSLRVLFKNRIAEDVLHSRFLTTKPCWYLQDRMVTRTTRLHYFTVSQFMATPQVFAVMRQQRVRPALFSELVGLYREHPKECAHGPIVALGSSTDESGEVRVAYLHDQRQEPLILDLTSYSQTDWSRKVRFLVSPISHR